MAQVGFDNNEKPGLLDQNSPSYQAPPYQAPPYQAPSYQAPPYPAHTQQTFHPGAQQQY
ncbi:unnamed protein product, partial [Didymodactylos carnosus]